MGGLTRARAGVAGAALIAVAVGAGVVLIGNDEDKVEVETAAAPQLLPTPTKEPKPACTTAERRFVPTTVSIPSVDKRISVLPLPRDLSDIPGTPPLTLLGKSSMAFDLGSGIRPGDKRGNVLLNAHTFPDGSALGNKLLDGLRKGDEIVLSGPAGKLCYEVTKRVEVLASVGSKEYYATKGRPQIAIVVCSGERLGPGEWTKRTLWFASPMV
ncbi:MAG: class F sortase [Sporichthyaceae bacterium]